MIELAMIFVGGLLGSAHCIGMCGGFALAIGMQGSSWSTNLARQLVYTAGRVSTYTLGGMIVGFAGWRLSQALPGSVPVQGVLSVVAGVLLVVAGLSAAGLVPWPAGMKHAPCLLPGVLRTYLSRRRASDVFLAGVATGFLPCGLVYAFLALASASGTMWQGGLRMMLFGLGTAPVMIATGLSGSLVRLSLRRHVFRIAAWCVVAVGLVSVARGVQVFTANEHESCPFCDRH